MELTKENKAILLGAMNYLCYSYGIDTPDNIRDTVLQGAGREEVTTEELLGLVGMLAQSLEEDLKDKIANIPVCPIVQ